jgi:hypothetical protein
MGEFASGTRAKAKSHLLRQKVPRRGICAGRRDAL